MIELVSPPTAEDLMERQRERREDFRLVAFMLLPIAALALAVFLLLFYLVSGGGPW